MTLLARNVLSLAVALAAGAGTVALRAQSAAEQVRIAWAISRGDSPEYPPTHMPVLVKVAAGAPITSETGAPMGEFPGGFARCRLDDLNNGMVYVPVGASSGTVPAGTWTIAAPEDPEATRGWKNSLSALKGPPLRSSFTRLPDGSIDLWLVSDRSAAHSRYTIAPDGSVSPLLLQGINDQTIAANDGVVIASALGLGLLTGYLTARATRPVRLRPPRA
jgi:hypothetical protein